MRVSSKRFTPLLALGALLVMVLTTGHSWAAPGDNFRFLTVGLPDGTTNGEYAATLLTANAGGPVMYDWSGEIPPGLSLDPLTGFISGRPTDATQYDVTFTAFDQITTITLTTTMKISSAGGGGNAGASFANDALAQGRVGDLYADTLIPEAGVGPFIFGAKGLPSALSLDGLTGVITGTLQAAGTFYVNLSLTDKGENDNAVTTTLPLLSLPQDSDFQFVTFILNNGEVGTPFSDTWVVTGSVGPVAFSATGLPPGLTVISDMEAGGVVTGTPTVAGTFEVTLMASDGQNTITANRPMWIAPSSTSHFHWDYFGIPSAIVNIDYDRQPPIYVAAKNGIDVTYSAVGLPVGILYDPLTGELSGIPLEMGIFPTLFTATDNANGEVLILNTDFVVLGPDGGDARDLSVNLWVTKQSLKSGDPGSDKWKGKFIYNADRRTSNRFNPATDTFQIGIGSRTITLDPGTMTVQSSGVFTYKSPKGEKPKVAIKVDPRKQIIQVKTSGDTLPDGLPCELENTVALGPKSFRLNGYYDDQGNIRVAAGYRSAAFVVSSGKITVKGAGNDSAKLKLYLADPEMLFQEGDPLRVRVLEGGNVLVDKDLAGLVTVDEWTDQVSGATFYTMKKSTKDASDTDVLTKFQYDSESGKMFLNLSKLDLADLTANEAHVMVEVTIGQKSYYTSVTVFEPRDNKYTTKMTNR